MTHNDLPAMGDPMRRIAVTDLKINAATIELLRTRGLSAVTVEAVCERSGVAKTTIYRRHANRDAMLRSALNAALPPLEMYDTKNPRRSLLAVLTIMCEIIEQSVGLAIAAAIFGGDDPATDHLQQEILEPRAKAIAALLEAGVRSGTLDARTDCAVVSDSLIGATAIHYARFRSFDDDWPQRLVAAFWPQASAAE